jgi:hypothetical protein
LLLSGPEQRPAPCRRHTNQETTVPLPTPPPWLADLPPLHHPKAKALDGQPSPATSHWDAGKPIFSQDLRKSWVLALRRRCWICGYPLATESPGYVISTEPDSNGYYGALHTNGFGPAHRSCAFYACAGPCPYLAHHTSRRRLTDHQQRGTALIRGFRHYAVVFPPALPGYPTFGYYDATEAIPLTNTARMAALYAEAVTADVATNFTAKPRLTWTAAPDDMQRLVTTWSEDKQQLQAWARTAVLTIDGHNYRGHALSG